MTTRIGIYSGRPFSLPIGGGPSYNRPTQPLPSSIEIISGNSAPYSSYQDLDTFVSHDGIFNSYADNLLFDRIWFTPSEVNARFITAASYYPITIWNAYLRANKPFTGITSFNPAGTSITDPTPYNLQPTADTHSIGLLNPDIGVTITVNKDGPSIQNTNYYLTIAAVMYPIAVRGVRTMSLAAFPDFATSPKFTYTYETTLFQSERGKEQRRVLRDIPIRTLSGDYLLEGIEGQKFFNKILYGHDKLFATPIINELMKPTVLTTGTNVISISGTTADKWNFVNFCDFIIITDGTQIETHEIVSYTSNTITTLSNIILTWDTKITLIYPAYLSVADNIKVVNNTNSVSTVSIDWIEKKVAI